MTTKEMEQWIEVMKQNIEALKSQISQQDSPVVDNAIAGLEQCIAKAERVNAKRKEYLKNMTEIFGEKQMNQRAWVGLNRYEIDQGLLGSDYALQTAHAWRDGVEWAEKKLKEKNA